MFDQKTVLVLGAGASWHYGYPTGEALVGDVISASEAVAKHLDNRSTLPTNKNDVPDVVRRWGGPNDGNPFGQYKSTAQACRDLATRLRTVSPLVIDYFLGWNQDLADLGKTMIAFALLKRSCLGHGVTNYNRVLAAKADGVGMPKAHHFRDNWIRFVIHQLLLNCKESGQLFKNQLQIITFNYDLSAEIALESALRATNFLTGEHIDLFMGGSRFLHMYGALKPVQITHDEFAAFDGAFGGQDLTSRVARGNAVLDACEEAAKDIRVIDPHNKNEGPESQLARQAIREAAYIYVLGFGFDGNNVSRLGFPMHDLPTYKKIFFTNLDNAMSVNKRVYSATRIRNFIISEASTGELGNLTAEKSTRDCYQALALDFGAFEDCADSK